MCEMYYYICYRLNCEVLYEMLHIYLHIHSSRAH